MLTNPAANRPDAQTRRRSAPTIPDHQLPAVGLHNNTCLNVYVSWKGLLTQVEVDGAVGEPEGGRSFFSDRAVINDN